MYAMKLDGIVLVSMLHDFSEYLSILVFAFQTAMSLLSQPLEFCIEEQPNEVLHNAYTALYPVDYSRDVSIWSKDRYGPKEFGISVEAKLFKLLTNKYRLYIYCFNLGLRASN